MRLLEMEDQPGYHSTGRSAALFSEAYGNDIIRALTRASRETFYTPPAGFCTAPLVRPRDVLMLAREGQEEELAWFIAATAPIERIDRLSPDEAVAACPIVRPERLAGAAIGRRTADIDVIELHQAYLRLLKARGGSLVTSHRVDGLARDGEGWSIATS